MERPPLESPSVTEESTATPESIETVRQLRAFLDEGYLLHGSKRRLESLEPRQATDTDKTRTIGTQNAVYATRHLEIPLFMALKDVKDSSIRSWRSGYSGNHDGTWHMYGDENTTLTSGYVYVLPPDTFERLEDERGGEELISRESVMPVAVYRVEPDIMKLFPNIQLDLK